MNLFLKFVMSFNNLIKFGYGCIISALACIGVQAVTLVHLFEFDNNLNDSLSSTVIGPRYSYHLLSERATGC